MRKILKIECIVTAGMFALIERLFEIADEKDLFIRNSFLYMLDRETLRYTNLLADGRTYRNYDEVINSKSRTIIAATCNDALYIPCLYLTKLLDRIHDVTSRNCIRREDIFARFCQIPLGNVIYLGRLFLSRLHFFLFTCHLLVVHFRQIFFSYLYRGYVITNVNDLSTMIPRGEMSKIRPFRIGDISVDIYRWTRLIMKKRGRLTSHIFYYW